MLSPLDLKYVNMGLVVVPNYFKTGVTEQIDASQMCTDTVTNNLYPAGTEKD